MWKPRTQAYLGDYVMLTETEFGALIYVDTRDLSLSPHLIARHTWEPWVTRVLMERMQAGQVFVDVGANCGWYSLLAASMGLTVHSFEPNYRLAHLMERTRAVNGLTENWTIHAMAAGEHSDGPQIARFAPEPKNQGGAGLKEVLAEVGHEDIAGPYHQAAAEAARFSLEPLDPKLRQQWCQVHSLDQVLGGEHVVHHLKVDVEGFEASVIRGAEHVLSRSPTIELAIEHNEGDETLIQSLLDRGFRLGRFDHQGKIVPCTLEQTKRLRPAEMLSFLSPSPVWL